MLMFNRQVRPGALINLADNFIHLARLVRLDTRPIEIDALAEIDPSNEDAFTTWLSTHFKEGTRTGYIPAYCGFHPAQRVLMRENVNARRFSETNYLAPIFMEAAKVSSVKDWQIAALQPNEGVPPLPDGVVRPALLLGIPWTVIREQQQNLLAFGLRPRRLELGTLPMLGSLCRHLSVSGRNHAIAVCEVEYAQTRLYVVAKDGVHTLPPLPHGLLSILETGMKEVGAPDIATARRQMEEPPEAMKVHDRRVVRALSRHLKPAIDHFELRTGQRIDSFYCTQLPSRLEWLGEALGAAVELELISPDFEGWLANAGITVDRGSVTLNTSWLSTFSLVTNLGATLPTNG
ncbi:MAG: hypothetical protein JWM88_3452 [Verrucomicrobia bacterium]|nr:hypothetical protein [Verrucomicrobiota bacterium]